eukprot:s446_g12.t1
MAPLASVQGQVKALFAKALKDAFPSLQQDVLVAKGNPKYGDYQCNNAMMIFKEHGSGLGFDSPLKVAEAIRSSLPASKLIGEISVAPQGFVTVRISQDWLSSEVGECLLKGDVSYLDLPRKRVVVDYSSPNIAKEMHVGHLRSTIIGESVRRVLEFCGHEVHGLNHVGDWGTQFGMLIEYMKEAYPNFQDQLPEVHDLQEFYKASKKRFDEDADFKTRAQLAVVDLQAGGEFARSAWQKICEVSRMSFNRIYQRLNISIEERGESFYNAMIPPLVDELKVRRICQESEGAMCIFTPSVSTIPLMAVKSDGGFGYDSTDLAAIYHRLFVMRADWVIYVTDLGQDKLPHNVQLPKIKGNQSPRFYLQAERGKENTRRSTKSFKKNLDLEQEQEHEKLHEVNRLFGEEAKSNVCFYEEQDWKADPCTHHPAEPEDGLFRWHRDSKATWWLFSRSYLQWHGSLGEDSERCGKAEVDKPVRSCEIFQR